MTLRRAAAAFACLLLVLVAACGEDGDDAAAGGGRSGGTTSIVPQPAAAPGFDGETIRLGAIATAGVPGQERLLAGLRSYFDAVNEAGGVAGAYPVELVVRRPAASDAATAYGEVAGTVAMFALVLGDEAITTVLPELEADALVAGTGSPSSAWIGEQHLLPIGSPYEVQAANAVSWYVGGGSGGAARDTLCAVVADDPAGAAGLAGLELAAEVAGTTVAEAVVLAPDGEPAPAVDRLDRAGCDMVYVASSPLSTGSVLAAAAATEVEALWVGQSSSWDPRMARADLLPYLQDHFVLVGEGTEWGDTSVPGMAQLVEDAGVDQLPGLDFALGYAQARAVRQVLEAAVLTDDLSRRGVVDAMNSLPELTFDGLAGDYQWGPPGERRPPLDSTIFRVDPAVPGALAVLERAVNSSAAAEALDPAR